MREPLDQQDKQTPPNNDGAASLLAAIVASSSDAIISKTLDSVVTSWNAAARRLFGYAAAEMIGQSIRRIIPADRQAEEDDILARIAAGERIENYETIRLHKDGHLIEVSVTVSPVYDGKGRIYGASKIARDITERKTAERQIQLLMAEVNHRAKNMLGVVLSMAYLTSMASTEDYLERFSQRLRALADNQDILIRNNWRGVALSELVRVQCAPFEAWPGARINAQGANLSLNPNAAQTLGLALHELATNACKYGALSNVEGRVDVRWRQENGDLIIAWTERGGPPVLAPSRQGFGSSLILDGARTGLHGTAEIKYLPSGVVWSLRCPASNALDAPLA